MIPDNLLKRIEKLLAMTASSNKNEAAVAMGKAQQMLDEYNLTRDDIKPGAPRQEYTHELVMVDNPYHWRVGMYALLAEENFCQCLHAKMHRAGSGVILIGLRRDIDTVRWLYSKIEPALRMMCSNDVSRYRATVVEEYGSSQLWGRTSLNAYRQSWFDGAQAAIGSKLHEQRAINVEIKALIAFNKEAVDGYMNSNFKVTKSERMRHLANLAGFHDGHEAGSSLNLRDELVERTN